MLYLECYSGISGDMTVSALLDLGADAEHLTKTLATLPVDGYEIKIGRRVRAGIEAASFDVILASGEDGGSHDYVEKTHHEHMMDEPAHLQDMHEHAHEHTHAHGHMHEHKRDHEHVHDHEHMHGHAHSHDHGHGEMQQTHTHHHAHVHRNLFDVTKIIEGSQMTDRAKETALRIFGIVAGAEAKVHGKPLEEVHFHEVGAVDSIVDICAAAICLDELDITECVISEISEGYGHVHCQHGILPVPVPATMEIAASHDLPLRITDQRGEMVTPTGAAIAAGIRTRKELPDSYRIKKVGMGSGKKEFAKANVLRALLIEEVQEAPAKETAAMKPEDVSSSAEVFAPDTLWMLESNIDDCSGEALGFVMEQLLAQGARDVCYIPCFMKKNRPAWLLKVICKEDVREELETLIFVHTTTIGIRRYPLYRTELPRKIITVETPYGAARVKQVSRGERTFFYPEYEDAAALAKKGESSFQEMYDLIRRAAMNR